MGARRDETSVSIVVAVLIVAGVGVGGGAALTAVGEAAGLDSAVGSGLSWGLVVVAFALAVAYLARTQRRAGRD